MKLHIRQSRLISIERLKLFVLILLSWLTATPQSIAKGECGIR
ncbi:MAG: hypothetical protein R3C56_38650 [Pirellulaceae bacterium]